MWLYALFFHGVDSFNEVRFNLGRTGFAVQTLVCHSRSTRRLALSVPRPTRSQRRLEAKGAYNAPACSCFKDSEGATKDSTGDAVPAHADRQHIGGQQTSEDQRTEDGSKPTRKRAAFRAWCTRTW